MSSRRLRSLLVLELVHLRIEDWLEDIFVSLGGISVGILGDRVRIVRLLVSFGINWELVTEDFPGPLWLQCAWNHQPQQGGGEEV